MLRFCAARGWEKRVRWGYSKGVVALLKRGINGTWHQVSAKHLDRYVNEVVFRLNDANVKDHMLTRLDRFLTAAKV